MISISDGSSTGLYGRFAQVLLLAVVISVLLMAALFEDFVAPIAVMVTVPLAAAGGFGALALGIYYTRHAWGEDSASTALTSPPPGLAPSSFGGARGARAT